MVIDEGMPTELAARLDAVESAIVQFHRRSEHREAVIDRLHEENQHLRCGLHRSILEPVLVDLIRLYDGLVAQAARLADDPAEANTRIMFTSFADDVEMTLDRCGIDVFTAVPGDAFDATLHTAVDVLPCTDPERHNTVAVSVTTGFRERETGRIRRPAKARFHQYQPVEPTDTDGENGRQHEE